MATLTPRELDFADTAPVIAESVGLIDGTAEEVWAAICDHENWPRWFTDVKACRPTSNPPSGVGSTREVDIPGGITVSERFIAWDEPEVWAFTAVGGPPLIESLVERITIKQLGPRLTEVTYRMAIGPRRGFGLMLKGTRRQLRSNLKRALRNLNGEVVSRRPAPAADAPTGAEIVADGHDHDHPHEHPHA